MTKPEDGLAVIVAVRAGDYEVLRRLIDEDPAIATARLGGAAKGRTALSIVTDWPGYFANGPRIAQLFIDAGANVNDRGADEENGESPLHWAASSDDSAVAAVLIDAGADLDMPNGSIGTPLANAVGYGCWNVARLLVAGGATVDALWLAAALGLLNQLEELLEDKSLTTPENISQAFWHACAGGQLRAAERLLGLGADLNWEPEYAQGTPLVAAHGGGTQRSNLIEWLKSRGAHSAESTEAGPT